MIDDLLVGAGVLASQQPDQRRRLAETLLYQAHAADVYAKKFGVPHPRWGNGSLMARALAEVRGALPVTSPCYASLAVMADAIVRFRSRLEPA